MKKKILSLAFFLVGVVSAMYAENLVFKMIEEGTVKIVYQGQFVSLNQCLGYTGPGTTISLGEIDFGNGENYFACSVDYANESLDYDGDVVDGVTNGGFIDFYLGNPDEGGIKFNDVRIKGTGAFQYYRTFGYNFFPEEELTPKGKGEVFVRFNNCNGNLRKITFYSTPIDDDLQGQFADPVYTYDVYSARDAEIVNAGEEKSSKWGDDIQAIGWTSANTVAKFAGVDFKEENSFQQIGVVVSHGGNNASGFLEIYIDDYTNEENMIAKIWTARDYFWRMYDVLGENLKQISGVHDLYVKWTAATSLREIRLIQGTPLEVMGEVPEEPELIDVEVSENAFGITFDQMGAIQCNSEIVAAGIEGARYEGNVIGYTSGGVVIKFEALDFNVKNYGRIIVDHSSNQPKLLNCWFDFYIDLESDDYSDISTFNPDLKVASVMAQGTASWANNKKTAGELFAINGIHDLYMVFNFENIALGANIFGIYLDTDEVTSIEKNKYEQKVIRQEDGFRIDSEQMISSVSVYSVDGQLLYEDENIAPGASVALCLPPFAIYKVVLSNGEVISGKF